MREYFELKKDRHSAIFCSVVKKNMRNLLADWY